MNEQLADVIYLPASGLGNIDTINMTVSCELMKNQLPASMIEPSGNILVAQDDQSNALIFTIGMDGVFRLLKFENGTSSGFTEIVLSTGFEAYDRAISFDLSQDTQGRISIAVALQRTGTTNTDVFLAAKLSNDDTKTNWSTFFSLCKKIEGVDSAFTAANIMVGKTDNGKAPLVIVSGNINNIEFYYQINSSESYTAVSLAFPQNVHNPAAIELGYAFGQIGKFFLYEIGGSETILCQTMADEWLDSVTYDFSPGNADIPAEYRNLNYNCMATTAGAESNPFSISSDLYVGTDKGIILFKGAKIKNGGFQVVTDTIKNVRQVVVKEDANNISVWAMASPNRLYYIYGEKKGGEYVWNDPILFNSQTIHIAPIRKQSTFTNELYLVDQEENLMHCWQDPNSTIWNERKINTQADSFLLDFNSFTTQITITDQHGGIVPQAEVYLKSSEWIFVNINGKTYSLDVDNPAKVVTDSRGMINIIQMTEDISTPIIHLDAAFLDKTVNIYQNGKIEKGLAEIESGEDIQNAKDANGDPILTTEQSPDTLNGVSANLGVLSSAASSNKEGEVQEGHLFISLTEKGTLESNSLDVSHIPADFMVGMKYTKRSWKRFDELDNDFIKTGNVFDDIVTTTGDALVWMENLAESGISYISEGVTYLEEGVSFVIRKVGDVLQFVLTIADEILTIALDSFIAVFKVVSWILDLIGIDLGAILRWLGSLLGFDDIWETHKVIAALLENGVAYGAEKMETQLDSLKTYVEQAFDNLDSEMFNAVLPTAVKQQSLSQENSNNILNSSAGNWIFSQIMHNNLLSGGGGSVVNNNAFDRFVTDTIEPAVKDMLISLEQVFEDFSNILAGDVNAVYAMLPDLFDLVINPIKTIMVGIIDLLEDLIGYVQTALTGKSDMPFLSEMYKLFSLMATGSAGSSPSVVNGIALLVAIPYTYMYKAIKGKAPFENGTKGMTSSSYFSDLFGAQPSPFILAGASNAALDYSKYGGAIGAFAAVPASIISLLSAAADSPSDGKLSWSDKVGLGLSMLSASLTFPILKKDENNDAYNLNKDAWFLSLIKDMCFPFIKEKEIAAGLSGVVNVIILGETLAANIINKDDGWAYSQNILSNCGGSAAYGGAATKQTVVSVLGGGIAWAGAIVGMAHALDSDEIVHLINPAG